MYTNTPHILFYPSRAAYKLLAALHRTQIQLTHKICMDWGAGQGGFSAALLEQNPQHIYAFDIGYGVFNYHLKNHSQITLYERSDFRSIQSDHFSSRHWQHILKHGCFITADISFLSTNQILQFASYLGTTHHVNLEMLFLIKPQFNASHQTEKGILLNHAVVQRILKETLETAQQLDFRSHKIFPSAIKGRKGNSEYFFSASFTHNS